MYTVDVWSAKMSSKTGYSQPSHLPEPETAIQAFNIIMNLPML